MCRSFICEYHDPQLCRFTYDLKESDNSSKLRRSDHVTDEIHMNCNTLKATLFLQALLIAGCASSQTMFDPPRKAVGQIMVVGNEPFARLAVRVSRDRLYLVSCSGEVERLLLSHQGKIAELAYNRVRETRFGKEIYVVSVKFLHGHLEELKRPK